MMISCTAMYVLWDSGWARGCLFVHMYLFVVSRCIHGREKRENQAGCQLHPVLFSRSGQKKLKKSRSDIIVVRSYIRLDRIAPDASCRLMLGSELIMAACGVEQ